MTARFIQIHNLTSYPSALLNRDDAGFAKRLPFGSAVRTRISSQCLKRHWRTFQGESSLSSLDVPETVRSRYTFERKIVEPLVQQGIDEAIVRATTSALMKVLLGEGQKAKAKSEGESPPAMRTGQITVLGEPEVRYLRDQVEQVARGVSDAKQAENEVKTLTKDKDFRKNLGALAHASGLSAALFGRMVTSDFLARGDAAVHVAHSFTVHEQESEPDYFSAVDDLLADGSEMGSGHIGTTELTSGLYYGYVVVDVPLLVSNLTGSGRGAWLEQDRTLAGAVIDRLIQMIATVSPGAKLGSTAPYAYAQAMLVEAGGAQPRTLANAFLSPIRGERVLQSAWSALIEHVAQTDAVYPFEQRRALIGLDVPGDARDRIGAETGITSLPKLASWASDQIGAS